MTVADLGLATLAWLGTYVVHSTLLLGGIWLLTTLRPVRSPRLRERIWAFGLLAGLATAGLQLASGIDPLFGRWRLAPVDVAERAVEVPLAGAESADETSAILPEEPKPASLVVTPVTPDTHVADGERPDRRRVDRARSAALPTTLAGREVRPARSVELDPALPLHVFGELAFRAALAAQGIVPLPATAESAPPPDERDADAFAIGVPAISDEGHAVAATGENERGAALLARLAGVASRTRGLPWPRMLLGAWILAALGGMAWFLTSWSRLFAHLRHRTPLAEGPVFDILESLRQRSGLRARIRLSTSPTVPGPITLGMFRREICLPDRALVALTPAQTEAMLAHELGHVVRRDAVWFHVLALMERIFFFQPLNRVAGRRLHDTAEVLCDDLAVRWTGRRLALASCLTEIARWMVGEKQRRLPVPAMAPSRSRLGQRVERLLDDRRSPQMESRHRWFTPVATVLVAGVVGAVPGVTSGASAPPRRPVVAPSPAPDLVELSLRAADVAPEVLVLEEIEEEAVAEVRAPEAFFVHDLVFQQAVLEDQLIQLEAEIGLVRAEFAALELSDRFEETLDQIDHRVRSLRARRERMDELVRRLVEALEPPPESTTRFPLNEERP